MRCEPEGWRIALRKEGCGGGRDWERRDCVRSLRVGVAISVVSWDDVGSGH